MTAGYDAVVIGAGPAGSTSARGLARRGLRVLLVDRAHFPRPKVCGCCLNPRALATLARIGLGSLAGRLGAVPLTGLELATGRRRATLHHALGVALSRDALDAALVDEAVAAGAEFQPGASATLATGGVRLRTGDESREVGARFVVSATGLGDGLFPADDRARPSPRSKLGAGTILDAAPDGYAPGRVFMACGAGGYVGLVALEDGRLDVAAALDPAAVREAGGPGALASAILAGTRLPGAPGLAEARWRGTPALWRSPGRVVEGGVFRVGDSAGYVEPFTGEGMAWALAGGEALAATLADDPDPARRWAREHRRIVRDRQLACRAVARVLRSPGMTRALVAALGRRPGLARPLLWAMHRE
ncbi:NAD(P)/FAD-dependent oxidoreductase [Paludisphaera sp.]|uniref:NAD(P)/FAD-dependent oxidoreductase n=1 Tax=Paludisphaera sp. TaxID=2017432 RepID=UPI00301B7026